MTRLYKIKNGLLIENEGSYYVTDHLSIDNIFADPDIALDSDKSVPITNMGGRSHVLQKS